MALIEERSALIQNKLLLKLKDLGSFAIPCMISDKTFCDLSVSFVDHSVRYPLGILKVLLLRWKFYCSC